MTKSLYTILFLLTFSIVGAQNLDSLEVEVIDSNNRDAVERDMRNQEVFTIVENMPEFPGGMDAMITFLKININYPLEAKEKNIQGKVYINLIVGKDGTIRNAKVIRGVNQLLDDEALRVVNLMPKWLPGSHRGKPVNVSYNIPVKFKLN